MPTTILYNLKILTVVQISVGMAFSLLVAWVWGVELGASFAIGSGLMLANISLLAWTSWRLIEKKPVAWTVIIIVIKYAILLGSVFFLARTRWFDTLGAGLGVASFVLAVLLSSIISTRASAANIERIKQKKRRKQNSLE